MAKRGRRARQTYKPHEIGKAIVDCCVDYTDDIKAAVPGVLDQVVAEALAEIREKAPKQTGSYRKGWAAKQLKKRGESYGKIIYNKTDYQLTHLLEFGHVNKDGGRTAAQPHIAAIFEKYRGEHKRRMAELIEKGGK